MADQQKGQKADAQEQRMFEMASKQAAKALTSEQGARAVYKNAKAKGPDAAIAEAVMQTISQIAKAAQAKGVTIPPEVLQAAAQAVAQVLVALMVEAKLAGNPDELMAAVMAKMGTA